MGPWKTGSVKYTCFSGLAILCICTELCNFLNAKFEKGRSDAATGEPLAW